MALAEWGTVKRCDREATGKCEEVPLAGIGLLAAACYEYDFSCRTGTGSCGSGTSQGLVRLNGDIHWIRSYSEARIRLWTGGASAPRR